MSIPIKVEVFEGNSESPYGTNYYSHFRVMKRVSKGFICELVEELQEDYQAWVDFPSGERLAEIFVYNKQKVFEKLYVDISGNISTRFVFTQEK